MKSLIILAAASLLATAAFAKLPPLTEEAKAKAAEAAAKTAWSGKVDGYLLCKSQDKVAAQYAKTAKAAGKDIKPGPALPACTDPGPFVYTPAAPAVAAAVGAAAPVAANTAAAAPAKKP